MNYYGFNDKKVRQAFIDYLNVPDDLNKLTEKQLFDVKKYANSDKKADVTVQPVVAVDIERDYKQEVLRTYVETFYNKSPFNFDNDIYKNECLRFNEMLTECEDSANQLNKVKKILNSEKVNISSLSDEIYPAGVLNASLSSKNNLHYMFSDAYFVPDVNIYLNPSYKYYGDIAKFIVRNAGRQGLLFNLSTGMKPHIGSGDILDSMVINCRAKDLARFIEILEQYENEYPQKVSAFGATYEFLGKTRDWFSFGYVGQGNGVDRNNAKSCLDEMNFVINNYVLPIITISDSVGLLKFIDEKSMRTDLNYALKSLDNVDKVMKVIKSLEARSELITLFYNLSEMKNASTLYTNQNKMARERKFNMSYSQFRDGLSQKKDLDILRNENITAKININNKTAPVDLHFTRGMFADLLLRKNFRKAMKDYYLVESDQIGDERLKEKTQQIISYLNIYTLYSTYVQNYEPFMSIEMENSIRDYVPESNEELENCFNYIRPFYNDDANLKKIVRSLSYDQFQDVDIDSLNREQLVKTYIQLAGLDNIIIAMNKLNKNEALLKVRSFPHDHEEIIIKEREKRGRMLYETIAKESSENKPIIIKNLSDEARKDYFTYVKFVLRRNDLLNSMENE